MLYKIFRCINPTHSIRQISSSKFIACRFYAMRLSPYPEKPAWVHEDSGFLIKHGNEVKKIAEQVKTKFEKKEPFRIFHGSTNSTRQNVLQKTGAVDVSSLDRVLRVDTEKNVVLVEPNVPMDKLVEATLKLGLIPSVVTEFPGITVGGAFAGTAGESSSFKYGFFDRIVKEVEIVLPNGEIIQASEEKYKDLFRKIPSTMGTLGITTALEVRLEKAKKYVKLNCHPVKSMDEAVAVLENLTVDPDNSPLEFVDGIMYSPTEGAIITGTSTHELDSGARITQFSRSWDPWYYIHIQKLINQTSSSAEITEFVPIADYLFRYDRGGFWVGRSAFKYFSFPFNRLTRWFLDDFMHTRMLYRALHSSKNVISYVVQDCAVPFKTAGQFVKYTDKEFNIYPLWLCPLRQLDSKPTTFHPHECLPSASSSPQPQQILNIGLWGFGPKKYTSYIKANIALERKLHDLGGMKWLYSQTYYSESEFWSIYKKEWYDALRTKYHATHLPSVWQKVRVDVERERKAMEGWKMRILGTWPVAGVYGVWKAMWSGDWKIARKVRISEMGVEKVEKVEKVD